LIEPAEAVANAQPAQLLSLADALAISLASNPDLITIRGTANVSAAMVDVAGVYPWNPFVQAQYFPNGRPFVPSSAAGGPSGLSNYYIWVMQRFELAHQRRYREDSAIAALGQVRWNIRQAELTNVAQTERLFFTALYQRQLRDLATDAETLSIRLAEITERRFKAGLATPLQVTNVRIATRQARRQRDLADAAYQAARLALVQQMGLPADTVFDLSGDLTQYEWFSVAAAACRLSDTRIDDAQTLATQMAEARPDVLAFRAAISVAQANLNLARAARIQDVQAGPIYETADDGTRFIGLRLQRDFGIWNNGSAMANQRSVEVRQQRLAYEQLKRRAANEAAAAIDRYERARALAIRSAQEAPQSPVEIEQAIAQYAAGNAEIVDILAVQNNLLQETHSYLDVINEVALSAALVTQMTAIPPERLFAVRPPKYAPSGSP
jgi:outer membrane protein TolC